MAQRLPLRGASGQAGAEFVALLPLIAIVVAALWQLVLLGHAHWAAAGAARAAARAAAVGSDPARAARGRLPGSLERSLRLRRSGERVVVTVAVPRVPGLPSLGSVSGRAGFGSQR